MTMGKFFNDNLMHARAWPQRGKETLAQELMERRRRRTTEPTEEPGDSGALTIPKRVSGRPKLDDYGVVRELVKDALAEGVELTPCCLQSRC